MRGKPFLVAVAAFAIVLLGGAAIAGMGAYRDAESSQATVYKSDDTPQTPTTSAPETTTTAAEEEVESNGVKAEDPATDALFEAKSTEPEEETDTEADLDAEVPAPTFALTHPENGSRFTSKVIAFGGTAGEGITVHRGKYEAIPENGEWSMELVLSPGKNLVSFEGIDPEGNTTVATVTVFYDAPADDGKAEKATFVAHQTYGSCSEEIPYDIFYGSAAPGAKITARSAYGGNSTTANENGSWEMKVTFPDAPSGKAFNVTIKASTGQSKTFSFTNTGAGKDG
ncbi:MAG: hypothetical protein BMS9Abin12_0160 [Acidimicrobiia bacterium]|nr:MAG: hypothetical protein BMS9Abin12_0160 [Acidimicrobiia bacterium]